MSLRYSIYKVQFSLFALADSLFILAHSVSFVKNFFKFFQIFLRCFSLVVLANNFASLAHPLPFVKLFFQDFANFLRIRCSFAPPAGDLHILARLPLFVKHYFTNFCISFFSHYIRKKEPLSRLLILPDPLSHIVDQTITSVVSSIDNRKASAVVFITEGEEVVSQQVHLHDSFFSGHGLKVELFRLDDA